MISSHSLAEIQIQGRADCAWPECPRPAEAHGFCNPHRLRMQRGGELGCETSWERVLVAFARLVEADTEDDAAYLRLRARAEQAMRAWRADDRRRRRRPTQ